MIDLDRFFSKSDNLRQSTGGEFLHRFCTRICSLRSHAVDLEKFGYSFLFLRNWGNPLRVSPSRLVLCGKGGGCDLNRPPPEKFGDVCRIQW